MTKLQQFNIYCEDESFSDSDLISIAKEYICQLELCGTEIVFLDKDMGMSVIGILKVKNRSYKEVIELVDKVRDNEDWTVEDIKQALLDTGWEFSFNENAGSISV